MRASLAVLATALVLLAACGKPKEAEKAAEPTATAVAAPTGFVHDPALEAAGYYRPTTNVQVGNFKLTQIAIGAPSDLAEWEAGKREGIFGPVLVEFDDVTSPKASNELGAEVHTVRRRALPQSYRLFPGEVGFSANDATLGMIVFQGKFDQATFADAQKSGSSGDTPVLVGDLSIGQQRFEGVRFTYWVGD